MQQKTSACQTSIQAYYKGGRLEKPGDNELGIPQYKPVLAGRTVGDTVLMRMDEMKPKRTQTEGEEEDHTHARARARE